MVNKKKAIVTHKSIHSYIATTPREQLPTTDFVIWVMSVCACRAIARGIVSHCRLAQPCCFFAFCFQGAFVCFFVALCFQGVFLLLSFCFYVACFLLLVCFYFVLFFLKCFFLLKCFLFAVFLLLFLLFVFKVLVFCFFSNANQREQTKAKNKHVQTII